MDTRELRIDPPGRAGIRARIHPATTTPGPRRTDPPRHHPATVTVGSTLAGYPYTATHPDELRSIAAMLLEAADLLAELLEPTEPADTGPTLLDYLAELEAAS